MKAIEKIEIPGLKLYSRGKVRDIFELAGNRLLMVATDRISAFDKVVGVIPRKGKILNQMSVLGFGLTENIVPNHFISVDLTYANNHGVWLHADNNDLIGRSMVVWKTLPIPVECVVHGYLSGSGWKDYQESGRIGDITLPPGLKESAKLPGLLFTSSTKAEAGQHDKNIGFDEMVEVLRDWMASLAESGEYSYFPKSYSLALAIKKLSFSLYCKVADHAHQRGIIIADTKLEFGWWGKQLILIDEIFTPDSSRFWLADKYQPGRPQESFDKQYLRDWLSKEAGWDKESPPPLLPKEVIKVMSQKYQTALSRLRGAE